MGMDKNKKFNIKYGHLLKPIAQSSFLSDIFKSHLLYNFDEINAVSEFETWMINSHLLKAAGEQSYIKEEHFIFEYVHAIVKYIKSDHK
jgi:hypothetical protein